MRLEDMKKNIPETPETSADGYQRPMEGGSRNRPASLCAHGPRGTWRAPAEA